MKYSFILKFTCILYLVAVLSAVSQAQGGIYSPSEMNILMHFKCSPLLTDIEKDDFNRVLSRRNSELSGMEDALKKKESKKYYENLKRLLLESSLLRKTAKNAKMRLQEAIDKLKSDFEPFGSDPGKWPPPVKAENEKLKKGKDINDKFLKADEFFFKYVEAHIRTTYEICIQDPDTFVLNKTYLGTALNSSKDLHNNYKKILDGLKMADKKARSMEKR